MEGYFITTNSCAPICGKETNNGCPDKMVKVPNAVVYAKRLTDTTFYVARIDSTRDTVLVRGAAAGSSINSLTLAVPSLLFGTPINFSNSLGAWSGTMTLNNQNPNTFFAGPTSGSPGAPTMRQLVVNDLPINIPNGNLLNSSITFGIGTSGTSPNWSTTSPALGSSTVLNIPLVNSLNTGLATPTQFGYWNQKVDSITISNDSIYKWANGIRTFQGVVTGGGGGSGTVTNFVFTNGGGISGIVTNSTTTPTLSLAPSFTGLTFSNGSAFAAATVSSPLTYSAGTLGIQIANTSQSGAISNTDWNTFNTKQNVISLTTTGTTGASTFISNTLNIPQYQGQLTLTTTGTSGASTLIGNTLNIPQYTGGGGGGISQLFGKFPVQVYGTDTVAIPFRVFNVIAYGADSTGIANSTPAFQAAINAAFAAGGGIVYAPAGTYLLTSALQTQTGPYYSNSQLTIPFVSLRGTNTPSITIAGERAPSFESSIFTAGYAPVQKGATIIKSTITGSGTLPSVIGPIDSIQGTQHWNATEVALKNIIIRTNTKAVNGTTDTVGSMCGVNFLNLTGATLENVRIDITSDLISSKMPNATVGLLMPHANNSAWNYLNRVAIFGYFTGMNINEHTDGDNIFMQGVDTAVQMDDMNHSIHFGKILLQGYVHGFHATNNAYIQIDNLSAEHLDTSTCVHLGWYNWKDDVSSETTSGLWGNINYNIKQSCGTSTPIAMKVVNNAANLVLPNFSYNALNQSPLPPQTIIGNGSASSNVSIVNQPNAAGLTIASIRGKDAEFIERYNSDSGNYYNAFLLEDSKTGIATYSNAGTKYIVPSQVQFVEKMYRSTDGTTPTVLTRDPYEFNLNVPLVPMKWTTSTRPSSGIVVGSTGYNTDSATSSCAYEVWNGSAWVKLATGSGSSYTLPIASASVLGGIKVGSGLSIDGTGVLSTTGASPTFQNVLDNGSSLTTSHTVTGGVKSLYWSAFDTLSFNANYVVYNNILNVNAGNPQISLNSSNGSSLYSSWSANGSTGEVRYFVRAGGFFPTFYSNNAERMRIGASGTLIVGGTTEANLFSVDVYNGGLRLSGGRQMNNQGASGLKLVSIPAIFTDASTAATTHIAYVTVNNISHDTLSALQPNVVYDTAVTFRIGRPPIAKTNITEGIQLSLDVANRALFRDTVTANILTLSSYNAAGANDSTLTWDPVSKSVRMRSGTFNLFAANGLTAAAGDSIYWGGTLNQATTISGAGFAVQFGTSGSNLGGFSITGGKYNNTQGAEVLGVASTINNSITAASGTVTNFSAYGFLAPTITSTNASITYSNPSTVYIDAAPTMSTNSTATGRLYALNVNSGITHLGLGSSNISAVIDGAISVGGGTVTGAVTLSIGASTATQTPLRFDVGTDLTTVTQGAMWFNGTNLYFGDGGSNKRDLLNGIHNYVHSIFTPATGGTVNLVANNYNIINPSGAIATLTVNLPSSPTNNDLVYIKFTQTVTTVTYGNGTVVDGITAPVAGGLVILTYDSGTNSWY